jgi:hypothetical protein
MRKAIRTMIVAGLCIPLFVAAQSGDNGSPEKSNVVLPQDKGPDKIDVSRYPAEMQKDYTLYADKCAKCHTIARGNNTNMTRPEWERYVKRMMHKPNSGIDSTQGKAIFDFIIYDQVNRKEKNPSVFFRSLTDEEIEKLKADQHVQ